MSKKDEIMDFINTGKSVEDISKMGYNKKYILEVIRETKKEISNQDPNINIETMQVNQVEQPVETSTENLKISYLNDIEKIESFIQLIKNNIEYMDSIQVNFNISFKFSKGLENDFLKLKEQKNREPKLNPIEIYRENGEHKLKEILNGLEIEDMKDIIRKYLPDPRGYVYKWKEKDKVIEYILERTPKLAEKGNVFFSDRE